MRQTHLISYGAIAAGLVAFLLVTGAPVASWSFLLLLACPVMMIVMMRGMSGAMSGEDHTGHGCEHDPNRNVDTPAGQDR